jgi:hypothetical protein
MKVRFIKISYCVNFIFIDFIGDIYIDTDIDIYFMKSHSISLSLLQNKNILVLLIFTFGIGILLYQLYVNSIQTSLIEGFDLDTSNPDLSNIIGMFSGFFKQKCLPGCVRLENIDKTKCKQKTDENNELIYDCPWVCDTNKFESDIKNNITLSQQLSTYTRCSKDTQEKDCGSCVPNRVFTT